MTLRGIPASLVDAVYPGPIEEVLPRLADGSINTVFADPDYNVGKRYEGKSYSRTFDEYISWCEAWAKQCLRVLRPDGNLFIVNYPKNNAHLRVRFLDPNAYGVHEYVWVYHSNIGHGERHFTTAHRSILHCTKGPENRFYKNAVAVPYQNPTDKRVRALMRSGSAGRMPYSWFEMNLVKNVAVSKTIHSCQIPERLSEMLFRATTQPGDVALVLFGGSGAELVVCQRLGLHFISAEIEPTYRALIAQRLRSRGVVPAEYRMLSRIRARRKDRRSA